MMYPLFVYAQRYDECSRRSFFVVLTGQSPKRASVGCCYPLREILGVAERGRGFSGPSRVSLSKPAAVNILVGGRQQDQNTPSKPDGCDYYILYIVVFMCEFDSPWEADGGQQSRQRVAIAIARTVG